mmetsp:Transcript_9595/g.26093  ORF Transcript_9595/g.26093 Transcript_9595/m.26093 type:complete len:247 (-) Transcript_9595:672-1412(-)|eukprot:CAMPEP_0198132158 /NCGR_PEP_ID=MMETSP1442-20131203/57695_1 /TAXON_ID= /ORGANISM="Craspedostauros australis, Strain CCMP3328" /LENGTH=246 /DNA_ID=CAMNT_0043793099 /DNA_START=63 /DNA_END=803 /DNA_ORIENTATION=-
MADPKTDTAMEENDATTQNDTNGDAPASTSASAAAQPKEGIPSAVEFEPPLACVRRILKNSLPKATAVGKDASSAFARASGIFIIYLTACANDYARENRRQTITANDVLAAVKELEFDEFTPELKAFLELYRENEKTKKEAKLKAATAKKEAEDEAAAAAATSKSGEEEESKADAMDVDAAAGDNDNEKAQTNEEEGSNVEEEDEDDEANADDADDMASQKGEEDDAAPASADMDAADDEGKDMEP